MNDRAFLFADLAGFTALTDAHGDIDAADVATRLLELARAALTSECIIVKSLGDAVMVTSPNGSSLVSYALELADAVSDEDRFPGLRAGLDFGSAVDRDGDWFGAAVNLAARVAAHARAGEILCTSAIAAGVDPKLASVEPRGEMRLKNLPRSIALFELRTHQGG